MSFADCRVQTQLVGVVNDDCSSHHPHTGPLAFPLENKMPGRRRQTDSVGGKVEAGCAKCCSYCRFSPLGSAVCYSAIIITVATLILYLAGAGLSSAAEPEKGQPDGFCSEDTSLKISYDNYLKYTGVIVLLLVIAVIMSCCVCCGCFCELPKAVKIAAGITIIPVAVLMLLYGGWLVIGTVLFHDMSSDLSSKKVCRNVIVYVILLYIYLFLLIGFGTIVFIWKCYNVSTSKKTAAFTKTTKSRVPEGAGGGGGLVGKVGGAKMAMAVL
ncbi:PREDICTED: uncharacterized protein LOC100632496 [Amphimedon queenslandica]|uniref:Uncharacterized protein n=1 Tax=Amphimedon queenslandica TaxID=400682 RepID=A0A1X7URN4_AMPQE|nr:PREDICTED: uncharacterized protein LOC100632496 [Amphimedon queenslandica]|eukprot:XP_003387080.2 PREDICTED: uncharacterized protein LOC100632496 [Amphimedon queenslandica]